MILTINTESCDTIKAVFIEPERYRALNAYWGEMKTLEWFGYLTLKFATEHKSIRDVIRN